MAAAPLPTGRRRPEVRPPPVPRGERERGVRYSLSGRPYREVAAPGATSWRQRAQRLLAQWREVLLDRVILYRLLAVAAVVGLLVVFTQTTRHGVLASSVRAQRGQEAAMAAPPRPAAARDNVSSPAP